MRERGRSDPRDEVEAKYARLLDADLGNDSRRNVDSFKVQLGKRHTMADEVREAWHAWRARETQPEDQRLDGLQLRYAEDRNLAYAALLDDLLKRETGTGLKERYVQNEDDDPFLKAAHASPERKLPESASKDHKWPAAPGPSADERQNASIFERATPSPISDKSRLMVQAAAAEQIARGALETPRDRLPSSIADHYEKDLESMRESAPARFKSVERDVDRLRDTPSLKDPEELARQLKSHHEQRALERDPDRAERLYTRILALTELLRERTSQQSPAIRPLPTLTREQTQSPSSDLEDRVHRFNVERAPLEHPTDTSPDRHGAHANSDVFRDRTTDPEGVDRAKDTSSDRLFSSEERPPLLRVDSPRGEQTLPVPEALSRIMAHELEATPKDRFAAEPATVDRPFRLPTVSEEAVPIHVRAAPELEPTDPAPRLKNDRTREEPDTDPTDKDARKSFAMAGGEDTRPEGARVRPAVDPERTRSVPGNDLRGAARDHEAREEARHRENERERQMEKVAESYDRHLSRLRNGEDPERAQEVESLALALSKRADLQTHQGVLEAIVEHDRLSKETESAVILRTTEDLALALSQVALERLHTERAVLLERRNVLVDEARANDDPVRLKAAVLALIDSQEGADHRHLRRQINASFDATDPEARFDAHVCAVAHQAPRNADLLAQFLSRSFTEGGRADARDHLVAAEALRLQDAKARTEARDELLELRYALALSHNDDDMARRAELLAVSLRAVDKRETSAPPQPLPRALGHPVDFRTSHPSDDTAT